MSVRTLVSILKGWSLPGVDDVLVGDPNTEQIVLACYGAGAKARGTKQVHGPELTFEPVAFNGAPGWRARIDAAIPFEVVFLELPWFTRVAVKRWEELAAAGGVECIILSAWGCGPGGWFDGPLVRLSASGRIIDYVPQGQSALVNLQIGADATERRDHVAIAEQDDWAKLASLVGFAKSFTTKKTNASINFRIASFELAHMVIVAIVCKAFGVEQVRLCAAEPWSSWPPAWKRLVQNLGLEAPAVAHRSSPTASFPSASFVREISGHEQWLAMLINRFSDVIPRAQIRPDV